MSTEPGNHPDSEPTARPWVPPEPLETSLSVTARTASPEQSSTATTSSPGTADQPPRSAARRRVLAVGITAASLGLIAAIVALGVGLSAAITAAIGGSTTIAEPLMVGAPGNPAPLEATDCDDPCFGDDHLYEARLDASEFARLGTPLVLDPDFWYAETSPVEQYDQTIDYWRSSRLTPDTCLFTATETPTIITAGERPVDRDAIHWLASFESEGGHSMAVRALRMFPSADAAGAHLRQLHERVPNCVQYGADGLGAGWSTTVTPMPALELPPTVAAVGWVETLSGNGRYYAVDILRSNAVIRLSVLTDNSVSEAAFRTLAQTVAVDLAGWPLEVDGGWGSEGRPAPGFQPEDGQPLSDREPCRGQCSTVDQAMTLAPTAADLAALGLTRVGDAQPVGDTAGAALDARQAIETTNAQCRFALGIEPVVRGNPAAASGARLDELVDLGRYERSGTSIRIVARVFENPQRAEAYAAAAGYALNLCSRQTLSSPNGEVLVTMLQAKIVGYDSSSDPIRAERPVTHIGWQHAGGRSDRGHDLQYGNVVVRVVIDGENAQPMTESEVSRLLLPMIDRLQVLAPST
ncbi:MAG: hypothetical protein KIT89_05135 [Microcella sp.]|uniref:hypothetical protein n=1 Tax=Microcella sp. TaxID=1913979 RepID=UPI0024CA0253|nr:hypothetical protein [Microcella sp.]UYN84565.1 MAG: hypothetical protein KIT89_05135 [Microcella sp.]